jgi:hypothetical protein
MKDKHNYLLLPEDKFRLMKERMAASGLSILKIPIPRAESPCGYYPLTHAQKGIWFLSELEESAASYNLCNAVRVRMALQLDILKESVNVLVSRHESLRTRFINRDAEMYQYISDERELNITYVSLEGEQNREEVLLSRLTGEGGKPFHIRENRLIKMIVYRLGTDDHVIFLNIHHLIADGISLQMLTEELFAVYAAKVSQKSIVFAEYPVRYVDFARWQNDWVCEELLGNELKYWKQALENMPESCSLPADYIRPSIPSYDGDVVFSTLDLDTMCALKSFCASHHITLYHLTLAIFMMMIHKYTGEEDVFAGTPVSGRLQAETERLIGFFASSIILRSFIRDDSTVEETVKAVAKMAADALRHQLAPINMLTDIMKRSKVVAPFQLFFIFNSHKEAALPPGLEPVAFGNRKTKYDLTLEVTERGDRLDLCVEYGTQLYAPETIRLFLNRFETMLAAAVSASKARISELSLLTPEQAERIIRTYNDTFTTWKPEGTLLSLIEQQATRTPEALAVLADGESLSYRDLAKKVGRAAGFLARSGVKPYGRVGISMNQGPELLIVLLAVMKAGCVYVPLDCALPEKRLAYIKSEAGLCTVLSNQEEHRHGGPSDTLYVGPDADLWEDAQPYENLPRVSGEDFAYIMFTSGSTGKPKGVTVTSQYRQFSARDAGEIETGIRGRHAVADDLFI